MIGRQGWARHEGWGKDRVTGKECVESVVLVGEWVGRVKG